MLMFLPGREGSNPVSASASLTAAADAFEQAGASKDTLGALTAPRPLSSKEGLNLIPNIFSVEFANVTHPVFFFFFLKRYCRQGE